MSISFLQITDIEDIIGSKVIQIREKKDYIKNKLIEDLEECYYGNIYNDAIQRIKSVEDCGFVIKYECDEDIFIRYNKYWHIDDYGLEKLDDYQAILITTEFDKYLMFHDDVIDKIKKFKCKYQDYFKIQWLNGKNLHYFDTDSEDE